MTRILDDADAAERDRYRARSGAEATCGATAPGRAGRSRAGVALVGVIAFASGLIMFPKKANGR